MVTMELEWTWRRPGAGRQGGRGAPAVMMGLILGSVFSLLGLSFLGVGVGFALWTQHFKSVSLPVQGTVTQLHQVEDTQSHSVSYAPVFSFVARDGRSYSITSSSSSSPAAFSVGDTVPVLYDPADPSGAKIDSFWQLWAIAAVFSALGSVFSTIGISALVIALLQRRRQLRANGQQPWMANGDGVWTGRNIDPS